MLHYASWRLTVLILSSPVRKCIYLKFKFQLSNPAIDFHTLRVQGFIAP